MLRWRGSAWPFAVSIGVVALLAPRVVGDEQIPLRGVGELVVDSDETRKRLLTTELAVSRELVAMVHNRLDQTSEPGKLAPEVAAALALTMIERIHATHQTLEQLCPSVTILPWVRQEELCLQVLLKARAVEEAQSQLRESEKQLASVSILLQRRCALLDAITSLLPRQLELAKTSADTSADQSKISRRWLEVEQHATSLRDKIEDCVQNGQLDRIKDLSVEAQQLVEEAHRLSRRAWTLCMDRLGDRPDAAAIQSHVDTVCSESDGLLDSFDAIIAEILPQDSEGAELRSLQIKKLALLRDLLRRREAETRLGVGGSYGDLSEMLEEIRRAELGLCKTPGERIARCRQHVVRVQDALTGAEAEFRNERLPGFEVDRIRIRLVDAKILLLREQSRDDSN